MKKILLITLLACGLSARAAIHTYTAFLDGPSEPTPSLGTGTAVVVYDDTLHTLLLQLAFSGLTTVGSSGTTVSHIHAATLNPLTGTASVATTSPTFPGFPANVYSGTYTNTLNLTLASSYNAPFLSGPGGGTTAGAEAALFAALDSGRAYWNVHSQINPGGEIRGFLVPEPSSLVLLGLGIAGIAVRSRKRQ